MSESMMAARDLAKLSDGELQPLIDEIMRYPEAVRKVIAREANKRADVRRRSGPDEWERHEGVTVVECPSCGFCFDADHEDMDGGYSCPSCDVTRLWTTLKGAA